MRSKPNTRMIGLFVVGGILLFLGGIIVFTTADFFSRRLEYVLYFDSSLNGLDIGSPVSFRGVNIGQVKNIVMEIEPSRKRVLTPVTVEIEQGRFKVSSFSDQISLLAETPIKRMIDQGLRAQLQTKSWITGQMYIELEFHPSFPATLKAPKDSGYDEIPTIPSQLDQVQATLRDVLESVRKLDLQGLANKGVKTLETAHAAVYEIYDVTHKINQKIDPILAQVDGTTAAGQAALEQTQKTLKQLDTTIREANAMFVNINHEVSAISPGLTKGVSSAGTAFTEGAAAMRALKELAEFLERRPDALLTGKQDRR